MYLEHYRIPTFSPLLTDASHSGLPGWNTYAHVQI